MYSLIIILLIIIISIVLFFLQFYRDPERKIPKNLEDAVLSPADGWVINIVDLDKKNQNAFISLKSDKEDIKNILQGTTNAKYLVQIYLSPFDCHMTRSPMHGKITKITHIPGKLTNAFRKDAIKNERVEFLIKTKKETIKMLMVGAPLVHKIRMKVKENQEVKAGQRLAQFLWGSQVTLVLPKLNFEVKVGQHIKAGETIIAKILK